MHSQSDHGEACNFVNRDEARNFTRFARVIHAPLSMLGSASITKAFATVS
jgi:hypothetical protein